MVETVLAHERVSRASARDARCAALGRVGIAAPAERLAQYPHQFSGGMRQRVAIAIALLHRPGADHRRRADHRARRHRAGPDPLRDAAARARGRHRADLDHPRPRGDRRTGRSRGGDVRGSHRRGRPGRRGPRCARCTRTRAGCSTRCRRNNPHRPPAAPDSRHDAVAADARRGLRVPRALHARRAGVQGDARTGARRRPAVRCVRPLVAEPL